MGEVIAGRVERVDATSGAQLGPFAGGLTEPAGLTVGPDGALWVIGDTGEIVVGDYAARAIVRIRRDFHRQLQHFDHRPDFRRLLRGDGFRRAHLARDLARHRAGG